MSKKTLGAGVCLLFLTAAGARGLTIAGVGAVLHPLNKHDSDTVKNLTTFADGPRLVPANGGIWFLEADADRIAFFQNDTITEWPIRSRSYPSPYRHIGANPADFELDSDGTTIWFFENGTSGIELQQSVFGKLDTVTGEMTEWIMPISKPAGFIREPDGETVWVAMSQGSLLRINLATLAVDNFRAPDSQAYSGLVAGPDGNLYMLDFGNNRVVRFDPATLTETSWQTLDPKRFRELPTQPSFDAAGNLYFTEDVDGGAFGRLNLATGQLDRFASGFLLSPSHYFLQGNFIYGVETDRFGGDGRVVIVDQTTVAKDTTTITPTTAAFTVIPAAPLQVRSFTLTPITFTSSDSQPDGLVVASAPTVGVSRFTLPHGNTFSSTTSYSITVREGKILAGVRGALAEFTLLPPANPTDLVVPLALNDPTGAVRTDFLFRNLGAASATLTTSFYSTPIPPAPTKEFTFAAGQTLLVPNALGAGQMNLGNVSGSLRFTPADANVGDFRGVTRTYAVRPDGGTFGFELPAAAVSDGLAAGSSRALFFAADAGEDTVFGIYSPTGAVGSAVLHGPAGDLRGTYPFFLPSNNRVEFEPGASAFNAEAEPGDYVTFEVDSGTIFPYAVFQQPTQDAAVELPVAAASDFVFPLVGAGAGVNANFVSEILLANPDPQNEASVTATLYPLDPSAALTILTAAVPPGGTAVIPFVPPFSSFGSLLVIASLPVYALDRTANRTSAGDYAGVAAPVPAPGPGTFLVSGDSRLRNSLVLFNRGSAGPVTLQGFDDANNPTGSLTIDVGDHRPLLLSHAAYALGIPSAGRIEVAGVEGMRIYPWLTSTENLTGDPDFQASLPP
jgi:sugar lactone lactonase YvrE